MENKIKKLKKFMEPKKFVFKNRHVRYNWQISPETYGDRKLLRYHFVIADDRFLDEKPSRIIENFQNKSIINFSFEEVRRIKGKFKDTGLDYLLISYDTNATPKFLDFKGISNNIFKDNNLIERKVLSVEDYVQRMYG